MHTRRRRSGSGQRLSISARASSRRPTPSRRPALPHVEARVALGVGNLVQLLERIRRENRLVVERPLHGIARPDDDLPLRGLTLHGDR